VPTLIDARADGVTSAPIRVTPPPPPSKRFLDEKVFVEECAARINAFIRSYPKEARHILAAFLPYEHELASVHEEIAPSRPPGTTVAALLAGILQTHHGRGWVLTPVFGRDPKIGTIVLRLDVARQDADDVATV
jgi:hypothetical protein